MFKKTVYIVLIFCLALIAPQKVAYAQQQRDPVPVLNGMIFQFQTGTPMQNWYSPQLWQLIAIQTNNTGIYYPLQQFGAVSNIVVNGWIELPVGRIYSMTAFHMNGRSDWRIGINKFTDRVEYADIAFGQNQPYPLPSTTPINTQPFPQPGPTGPVPYPGTPQPGPTTPGPTTPGPTQPDPGTSEACKLYPDLC